MGKMLEHKFSWKVPKIFAQKCSSVDLWLTFSLLCGLLNGKSYGFGALVNKYILINEHLYFFWQ